MLAHVLAEHSPRGTAAAAAPGEVQTHPSAAWLVGSAAWWGLQPGGARERCHHWVLAQASAKPSFLGKSEGAAELAGRAAGGNRAAPALCLRALTASVALEVMLTYPLVQGPKPAES